MAQPEFETLRVAAEGPLGRLTLHRPERLNALTPAMLHQLAQAARWFDSQPEIRVVIVSGAGRAFCAGFDLNFFGGANSRPPGREDADLGRVMIEQLAAMRALTIAAIHGRCVGGGVLIAAACDLRLAADDAVFSIPEIDLGIPLAWGGIPRLVREIGPAMTRELVLDCREFSAVEARSLRLVNRCVPAVDLAAAAQTWGASLAAKAGRLLAVTKRQVNAAAERLLSPVDAAGDADDLLAALGDPECREMLRNYLAAKLKR
ncbi:MAG: enoyl-CoA hydratase/isomerase family protein [Betaproteobacteria bacterium]|nr:enoyl-CoA hydratase/isomerase family protein [Betaproteobacteria bacterium]